MPIINAGDGAHEHPSQALLDIYTLREKLGDLRDRKITILGDILFSRVARSNLWGLLKLGAKVTLAGPSTLVPREFEKLRSQGYTRPKCRSERCRRGNALENSTRKTAGFTFSFSCRVCKCIWVGLKSSLGHEKECDNSSPGPLNRGVEIESEVADSGRAVILQQVANGIAVRMAILHLCITSEKSSHS